MNPRANRVLAVALDRPVVAGGVMSLLRPEFRVAVYVPARDDVALVGPSCELPGCEGAHVNNHSPRLCANHKKVAGKLGLTPAELIAQPDRSSIRYQGIAAFDFTPLKGRLRAEFQYAVQCRHDERSARLEPAMFNVAVRAVVASGVRSILDDSAMGWFRSHSWRAIGSFLKYVHTAVTLAERPIEVLDRDLWVGADFHSVDSLIREHIHFEAIPPWLRAPVKRWALWRLNTGKRWKTVHMNVHAMSLFAEYLAKHWPDVRRIAALDRDVVQGFVTHLRRRRVAAQSLSDHTSSLRLFLDEYRIHRDWGPPLPSSAALLAHEVESRGERLPRPISEPIMLQIENEANLARMPVHVLAAVLVAIRCGLRISSILDLSIDCLHTDPSDGPTLHYRNMKRRDRRQRVLPLVDDDVLRAVQAQQAAVRHRMPGCKFLFPRQNANPDGRWHMASGGLQSALDQWLADCGIVDPATGETPRITFHRFRHTMATRLIANGASEYFVSLVLDHEDTKTTRGYAMLSDPQRREHFERFSKVNNRGEVIEGWTADHEWMKHGLARARATLPNGYCGLPVQLTCEMRNACLNCDAHFITTSEFLPVHERQLSDTRRLIATAEANGHFRMAENNRQVEQTLVRIIEAIEERESDASA